MNFLIAHNSTVKGPVMARHAVAHSANNRGKSYYRRKNFGEYSRPVRPTSSFICKIRQYREFEPRSPHD